MSLIVKRASRLSLNAFARKSIFDPLAMPNAVFRDRHDLPIPNLARGYAPDDPDGFGDSRAAPRTR
jgi:CubicO group peptidase (beta-lactamase class C family)